MAPVMEELEKTLATPLADLSDKARGDIGLAKMKATEARPILRAALHLEDDDG